MYQHRNRHKVQVPSHECDAFDFYDGWELRAYLNIIWKEQLRTRWDQLFQRLSRKTRVL
jgi:hypothetical protein